MNDRNPSPGVNRNARLSDEGLQRLERQLASGVNVSEQVLEQWIIRYGDAAREIIQRYKPGKDQT
jgi:hypothetical protein